MIKEKNQIKICFSSITSGNLKLDPNRIPIGKVEFNLEIFNKCIKIFAKEQLWFYKY